MLARVGGWLFKRRSWLPGPIALLLLVLPASSSQTWIPAVGLGLVLAGEALRLWAVRHIGVISRTRSDRLGPLVAHGPFRYVRNPLYLGNISLWVGFALYARLPWLAPLVLILLAAEYHAIVYWEEGLLRSRLGKPYLEYLAQVPRWLSTWRPANLAGGAVSVHTWSDTLFSERGTLLAIALGFLLLAIKHAATTA